MEARVWDAFLTARDKELSVIDTAGDRRMDGWDRGAWAWKNNRTGQWHAPTDVAYQHIDGNDIT